MESDKDKIRQKRVPRWYFGGLASMGGAICTHPLDLLKVHLQTQQEGKLGLIQLAVKIVKNQGILALYAGLTASIFRQLTYSTTRFGIYEVVKQRHNPDSFFSKVALAAGAGACGGLVGTPGDMVNVRMQNDIKLPIEKRRNYKHVLDGLYRVYREEGVLRLWSGASTATSRAVLMTVGQLAFYDQIKMLLLKTGHFKDNLTTHFTASLSAGIIATFLTQPIDVLKTRMMNAKPEEFTGLFDCIRFTARAGPLGFYKGFVPSVIRIAPTTIITFILFENITKYFGRLVPYKDK